MRHTLLRIFAVVLLVGQVVQVSGSAFCGLQRRHHATHCDGAMTQTAGVSIGAPAQDMASAACSLLGACVTPIPAVAAASANSLVVAVPNPRPAFASGQLLQFNPVPIPPPPQV